MPKKPNLSINIYIVITLVLAVMVMGFFMAYDRMLKSKFDQELFLLIFRSLLTLILAGIGVLTYRAIKNEQDSRAAQIRDIEAIYQAVSGAQQDAVIAFRQLRSSVGYERDNDAYRHRPIDSATYDEALETLTRSQLVFQTNASRARDSGLGYHRTAPLAELLNTLEGQLGPVIEEYAAESVRLRQTTDPIPVETFPELSDFILCSSSSHPFSTKSTRSLEDALAILNKLRFN